jgi:hypothetical protein
MGGDGSPVDIFFFRRLSALWRIGNSFVVSAKGADLTVA